MKVCFIFSVLHRKEVIQPHLPIRLPCYDFTPVINPPSTASSLRLDYGLRVLPTPHGVTGGRCVQSTGTYSPQHADLRLLAIPTSCRRVAVSVHFTERTHFFTIFMFRPTNSFSQKESLKGFIRLCSIFQDAVSLHSFVSCNFYIISHFLSFVNFLYRYAYNELVVVIYVDKYLFSASRSFFCNVFVFYKTQYLYRFLYAHSIKAYPISVCGI